MVVMGMARAVAAAQLSYIIAIVDKFWKVGVGGANVLCVMFFC